MVLQAKFVVMGTTVQLLVLVSMTLVVRDPKKMATTVAVVMLVKAGVAGMVVRLVTSPGVPWGPPVRLTPPRCLAGQIPVLAQRTCCRSFMPVKLKLELT